MLLLYLYQVLKCLVQRGQCSRRESGTSRKEWMPGSTCHESPLQLAVDPGKNFLQSSQVLGTMLLCSLAMYIMVYVSNITYLTNENHPYFKSPMYMVPNKCPTPVCLPLNIEFFQSIFQSSDYRPSFFADTCLCDFLYYSYISLLMFIKQVWLNYSLQFLPISLSLLCSVLLLASVPEPGYSLVPLLEPSWQLKESRFGQGRRSDASWAGAHPVASVSFAKLPSI